MHQSTISCFFNPILYPLPLIILLLLLSSLASSFPSSPLYSPSPPAFEEQVLLDHRATESEHDFHPEEELLHPMSVRRASATRALLRALSSRLSLVTACMVSGHSRRRRQCSLLLLLKQLLIKLTDSQSPVRICLFCFQKSARIGVGGQMIS